MGGRVQRDEKESVAEEWRAHSGEERRGGEEHTRERCSHHVRLYSETMKRAMRAISQSVTFSPSPWFWCFLPGCADEGRCLRRLSCL